MPELPEVETVRASLERALVGERLARVEVRRPDLRFPFPERFADRLTGRQIAGVTRRAKYLRLHLDNGEILVVHLGMTGRFILEREGDGGRDGEDHDDARGGEEDNAGGEIIGTFEYNSGRLVQHDHVRFTTAGGTRITYNDPRRFGFMLLLDARTIDSHALFRALGAEPLGNELDAGSLAARAAGRRTDLKAFLMDQRNVAGLGNIYVCEALFRARLSPRRGAATLAGRGGHANARCARLVAAIREVLAEAVVAGGSTLRDYRRPDGSAGAFQVRHDVYDRAGQPCRRPGCGGRVRRVTQSGRSTFYCPRCQT